MMRVRVVFVATSLVVVLLVTGLLLADRNPQDDLFRALGNLAEVVHLVETEYVDELNQEALVMSLDAGIVESLDPWAAVVREEELASFEVLTETPPAYGLSISARLGLAAVRHAVPGSPAAAAGLEQWEVVEWVDGVSTRGRPLWEVRLELKQRELEGRPVTLTVVDQQVDERREVVLEATPWQPEIATVSERAGVRIVEVHTLARGAAAVVADALRGGGVAVLDLRGLVWGFEDEAVEVADLLASSGVLASWRGRRAGEAAFEASASRVEAPPPVVLVGSDTEGPGEILAAGLRRAGAVLVGQSTLGHAPHMRLVHDDDLHLWLPVAYWLDADDEPIDHGGIEPDHLVEEPADDEHDPALERALELARPVVEAAA